MVRGNGSGVSRRSQSCGTGSLRLVGNDWIAAGAGQENVASR